MKIFLTLLACLPLALFAQKAERQVIGAAGNYVSTPTVQVSSTVGELITTAATSSSVIVSQGFQQANNFGVGVNSSKTAFTVNAFPNPTRGMLTLQFQSGNSMDLALTVLDASGKDVTPADNCIRVAGSTTHQLDLSGLAAGHYIVTLTNAEQSIKQTMKIQKLD